VVIDRQHGGAQVPAHGEYEVCCELRQQAASTQSSGALLQLPIDVALPCLYSRVQFGEGEAPHDRTRRAQSSSRHVSDGREGAVENFR
jgi:hypothetical protein